MAVLLCALASTLGEHFTNKPLYGVFSVIAVLTVLTVAASPILACVQRAGQMVESLSNFMLGFIPVFATVTALSGQPATGGTYHVLLFSATQIVSQVLVRIVVPFLMLYLAFSIAGSIFPQLKMDGFIASAKKIATVLMGLSLTLFVGLLTVQAFVGTSADTVTIKTTKFVVGNLVPVVGGALSDAVSSVQGCLKLLKSTVGAFGIIASLFIFIPIVLESLVWVVTLNIASAVGDLMGCQAYFGHAQKRIFRAFAVGYNFIVLALLLW